MATVHSPVVDSHLVVDSRLVDILPVVDSHLAALVVVPRQVCPVVVEHSLHTDWVDWGLAPG